MEISPPAIIKKTKKLIEDRGIDSELHNISSNPKARDTLELLASLLRSTKKKTLKDFEAYLNQVYKNNHGGQ